VDAEVDNVFGPRMFSIDERGWFGLGAGMLVYMPSQFAALVREVDLGRQQGRAAPEPRPYAAVQSGSGGRRGADEPRRAGHRQERA
jgi:hypothetical protein